MIHGGRDDLWPSEYAKVLEHRTASAWMDFVGEREPSRSMAEMTNGSQATFSAELELILNRLRTRSDCVAAVDLSRPELGIPVVKMVVAGMAGVPGDHRERIEPTIDLGVLQ